MVTYDGGSVTTEQFDKNHIVLRLFDCGGLDGSPPEGHTALINKAELDQIINLLIETRAGCQGNFHILSKTLRDVPDEKQPHYPRGRPRGPGPRAR